MTEKPMISPARFAWQWFYSCCQRQGLSCRLSEIINGRSRFGNINLTNWSLDEIWVFHFSNDYDLSLWLSLIRFETIIFREPSMCICPLLCCSNIASWFRFCNNMALSSPYILCPSVYKSLLNWNELAGLSFNSCHVCLLSIRSAWPFLVTISSGISLE